MVTRGEQHLVEAWRAAVDGLAMDVGLADALASADLLAVNLEGTSTIIRSARWRSAVHLRWRTGWASGPGHQRYVRVSIHG